MTRPPTLRAVRLWPLFWGLFFSLPLKSFTAVLPNIIVDQFGYQTTKPKIVLFSQPVSGIGSPSSFTPGATFNVINVSSGTTAFSGPVSQWNGGAVHSQSGDKVWQGDFSALTSTGTYYVQVPGGSNPGGQSYNFQLADNVYNGVVTASQRMFFYQRCGEAISPANGGSWNHAVCHEGAGQDLSEDLWDNGADQGPGTARDVHGGWHDAGDYGKYVTTAYPTLWYLLHSAEWYPQGYPDNTNIPESGNGVPDILDEVKWELDWMLRMQRSSDGALYSVVGYTTSLSNNPGNPANDTVARFYSNVSTTATATGAMAFALGSRILQNYPYYASYAATLQSAAVSAWGYLQANPAPVTYNATGIDNFNQNASGDAQLRVGAAAELFALTGNAAYQNYFDANYNSAAVENGTWLPVSNPPASGDEFDPVTSEPLELAMVSYCVAPGATASVVAAIQNALRNECEWAIMGNNPVNDPYLGYMYDGHYCWGSNENKAAWGNQLLFAIKTGANPSRDTAYLDQAEEYLHYFHGRNPLNWVYLTNMGPRGANLGASQPIMSIYDSWFWAGTTYDGNTGLTALGPAPGILSGGPNQYYAPASGTISPPQNEPPMKSYKDWGNNYPDDSWQVTEPDQAYQGKYQFLVSAFASTGSTSGPTATPTPTFSPTPCMVGGTPCTRTATPTNTPTPTPAVVTPLMAPNPTRGGYTATLFLPGTGPFDVRVRVYTVSFRKVMDLSFPQAFPGRGIAMPLTDPIGATLGNGLYYVIADTPQGQYRVKWLILR